MPAGFFWHDYLRRRMGARCPSAQEKIRKTLRQTFWFRRNASVRRSKNSADRRQTSRERHPLIYPKYPGLLARSQETALYHDQAFERTTPPSKPDDGQTATQT
jgi:hypothetical protein